MKKGLIVLLTIATGLVACTEPIENIQSTTPTKSVYNLNRRSYAEAVEIAQNSIKMLQEESATTRGNKPVRTLNLTSGIKAICQPQTRSIGNDSDNDTFLYVFNFNDEQGFAVVSANRQTEGLIAAVEMGSYDPAIPTGNPGFDTYMQMAKVYVANTEVIEKEAKVTTTKSSQGIQMCKPVYDTVFFKKINPRISVRWGQKQRMGQYCPNGVCGCSNTAAAQIMSYFQYPSSINLTFEERDVNSTALNWTAMCTHQYSNASYNRDEADTQIGRLARQLGKISNSSYHSYPDATKNSTETAVNKSRNTFQTLGYNVSNIINYDYRINANAYDSDAGYNLASKLAKNELIFMVGYNNENEGHAWVIDGCYYVKALHRIMCTYDGENWVVYQELGTNRTCHNHINWGWNGAQNGYFESYIFNAYSTLSKDESSIYLPSGENVDFYDNIVYFTVSH